MVKKVVMFIVIIVMMMTMNVDRAIAYDGPIHKLYCFHLIKEAHYVSFTAQQCAELDEKFAVLRGSKTIFDHRHFIEGVDDHKIEDMTEFIIKLMDSGYYSDALHVLCDLAQPDHVVTRPKGLKFSMSEHQFMDAQIPRVPYWDGRPSTGDVRENIKRLMLSTTKLRTLCFTQGNRMPTSEETGILFVQALSVARQLLDTYHVR